MLKKTRLRKRKRGHAANMRQEKSGLRRFSLTPR